MLPLEEEAVVAERDPDRLFDRIWMGEVVARAVERVRGRCQASRRVVPFLVFEAYDLAAEPPTYAELAAKFGVKPGDVRNYLAEVREKVREEAKLELAASGEPGDAADEFLKT